MRREHRLLLVAIVIVSAVVGAILIGYTPPEEGDDGLTAYTVDRCYRNGSCQPRTITERPEWCSPAWAGEVLDCNWTTDGVEDVTIISDPANYITAPRSTANITVTGQQLDGLETPWDLEFLPDGSMLVTDDRPAGVDKGYLYRYVDGERHLVKEFDVLNRGVGGLMGMAVHPDFPTPAHIYVAYTARWNPNRTETDDDGYYFLNRVERLTLNDTVITNRTTIRDGIQTVLWSAGMELGIGPDNKLYITTGTEPDAYQFQWDTTAGKVLRLNLNGTVPASNPYSDAVYAGGFKNPQGLDWHPETDELYLSMHGDNRHDEINHVVKGGYYGFPAYQCEERTPAFGDINKTSPNLIQRSQPPSLCFDEWTLAPSQMAFVDDPSHPWYGDLFVAGLRGKQVHRVVFENGEPVRNEIFWWANKRIRDIEFRDGAVMAVPDNGDTIRYLRPASE